jgi:DnaJ-class molecular chaperone
MSKMEFTLDELLEKIKFIESVPDRTIRVIEEEEECSACNGKGYFEYETGVTDGIYKEISKDICTECNGEGVL